MTDALDVRGSGWLLHTSPLGLLSSTRTPVDLYVSTLQAVREESAAGRAVIGAYHAPLERDCLHVILASGGRAIVCPGRSLGATRTPGGGFSAEASRAAGPRSGRRRAGTRGCDSAEWWAAMSEGRLAIVSAFRAPSERRVTAELAERRNALVVELAARLLVPHARPGTRTFAAAQLALEQGKSVECFDHPANGDLVLLGARPIDPDASWHDGRIRVPCPAALPLLYPDPSHDPVG